MDANADALRRAELRRRHVDMGLSTLLLLQGFTLFLVIPLGAGSAGGRALLDVCHLSFAVICIGVLTRRPVVRAALLLSMMLLVAGPAFGEHVVADLRLGAAIQHETIALVAFAFNGGVTALVARHVFAPGQVTVHRVRGAILLYLNVAALFAIADGVIAMNIADAYAGATGAPMPIPGNAGNAAFTYFSLTTITTTGYGDIVPVHPLARSLANLESVFGQLFPATLLARLVALHLSGQHGNPASEATPAIAGEPRDLPRPDDERLSSPDAA